MRLSNFEKIIIALILSIAFLFVKPLFMHNYSGPDNLPAPIQTNLKKTEYITIKDSNEKNKEIKVELVAKYQVTAGVRGRRNYTSDYSAKISPMDLILAWGDLNQPEIIDLVDYKQSGRWYYYRIKSNSELTYGHIGNNSSNTHIIPANDEVLKKLDSINENSFVKISGYLVNVIFKDGSWSSSLSRTDTGNGACEILLVEEVNVH